MRLWRLLQSTGSRVPSARLQHAHTYQILGRSTPWRVQKNEEQRESATRTCTFRLANVEGFSFEPPSMRYRARTMQCSTSPLRDWYEYRIPGQVLLAVLLPRSHDAARNELRVRVRYEYCLLYTSPSPRDRTRSRMPSSA